MADMKKVYEDLIIINLYQQFSRSNILAHIYILLVVLHKCGHAKPYLVVNVINGRKRANHVQTRSSLVQTD